jgi:hypothetical protein
MSGAHNGAAANRRYAGQLDDFMKFDCQDCIGESRSAAVPELWTLDHFVRHEPKCRLFRDKHVADVFGRCLRCLGAHIAGLLVPGCRQGTGFQFCFTDYFEVFASLVAKDYLVYYGTSFRSAFAEFGF